MMNNRIRILIAGVSPSMLAELQQAVTARVGEGVQLELESRREIRELAPPIIEMPQEEPPRRQKFERPPKFLRKGQRR